MGREVSERLPEVKVPDRCWGAPGGPHRDDGLDEVVLIDGLGVERDALREGHRQFLAGQARDAGGGEGGERLLADGQHGRAGILEAGALLAAVGGPDVPDFAGGAVGVEDLDGVAVGPDDVDVAHRGARKITAVDGGGDALLDVFRDLILFRACANQHGGGREEG